MARDVQERLLEALSKIDRPGTFCTSGRLPPIFPGLHVTGMGPVSLPLEKPQALAIRKRARQAPYGKGTETLIDTGVRRTWEIDADQITLANPEWSHVVQQAVSAVQSELGLENQKLSAHLYKLLLYEPGGFFLAHRDGEKLDRMVATLVVALPSAHEGGELIVKHEDREVTIDFAPESRFQTQYAAFYADCEHAIRPVKSGFRLALVYNLTLEKSRRAIKAPRHREHIAQAARLLGEWDEQRNPTAAPSDEKAPSKLAVLLDHRYSQAGLTRDALKGIDRARAEVLFAAACEAGFDASLALATCWQTGSAEPSGEYDYGYRRRRRYAGYEDRNDDAGGEHIMGEVYDSGLTASDFSDAEGNPLAFGELPLREDEIVSKEPLTSGKPDKEDFEGYTGNAGMTLERWYHRAAIVLWPTESRFDTLCEAGVAGALGGLEQMVRRWQRAAQNEQRSLKVPCLKFARRIIAHWPRRKLASESPAGFGSSDLLEDDVEEDDFRDDEVDAVDEDEYSDEEYDYGDDDLDSEALDEEAVEDQADAGTRFSRFPDLQKPRVRSPSFLSLLADLGDPSLIAAWLRRVLARDVAVEECESLVTVCRQHGWTTFQSELRDLFQGTGNETLERNAKLLASLALCPDKSADRRKLCATLAREMMSAVERWEPRVAKRDWRARVVNRRELLTLLTQAFLGLAEPALLDRLVKCVRARAEEGFDLTKVQVPALLGLKSWLKRSLKKPAPPLGRWLSAIVGELQTRKAHPPRKPADWRRESQTGCACKDCKELSRFLQDPQTQTLRLPLVENRRGHLHQIIDSQKLDTTHETERRGRPYTLVCTKTQASYERALQAYQVDLEHLEKVRALQEWHEGLPN